MKKVAFLLILFSCTLLVTSLNSNEQTYDFLLAARLNPPTKVVAEAEKIAREKSAFFSIEYDKNGGVWIAYIFNYVSEGGGLLDVEQATFKANGKRVD